MRGVVWPQGQPLCHLRQGWTTPTHPGLWEPSGEASLPLCHPRSRHRLGPTHPITAGPVSPPLPPLPRPWAGPGGRTGHPGTAGPSPEQERCARSRSAARSFIPAQEENNPREQRRQREALFRGAAPDPNREALPSPSPWLPWRLHSRPRRLWEHRGHDPLRKRRVPPRARAVPTPLASRPWNAPVRRPRAASPAPAATTSRLMTGCDCGG